MTIHSPLWLENDSYPASLDRQLLDVLASAGVVGAGDLLVTQRAAGANRSVDVAAGRGLVHGTDVSNQGKYLFWSDGSVNVSLATAPGTGQSRIDRLVAQIRDADAIGGSNNDGIIAAVTGTAASTGSQVAPATPASALWLADVLVGPNATTIINSNITDGRVLAQPGLWVPGRVLGSLEYGSAFANSVFNTTSASLVTVSSALEFEFVAPVSGRVVYQLTALMGTTASGQDSIVGASITGIGIVGNAAIMTTTPNAPSRGAFETTISGLTPGTTYTIQPAYEAGGGAGGTTNMFYGNAGYGSIFQKVLED